MGINMYTMIRTESSNDPEFKRFMRKMYGEFMNVTVDSGLYKVRWFEDSDFPFIEHYVKLNFGIIASFRLTIDGVLIVAQCEDDYIKLVVLIG